MKNNKLLLELTQNEMNVLANALETKIKEDVKYEFTPDTKKDLRARFRKHLNEAVGLRKKIHFV